MSDANDPTRITLYPCILSYPNLFIPRRATNDNEEGGYDCELWIYNDNPKAGEMYQKLQAVVNAAAEAKFGKGSVPRTLKNPIRHSSEKESWTGPEGFWVRAKSRTKPLVTEKDPASSAQKPVFIPVTDHDKVYPGVIVAAALRAGGFTFTDEKKMTIKGVTFYLNQILLTAPGTRLVASNVRPPEEEFGDITSQVDFQPISTEVSPEAVNAAAQMQYPGMQAPQYPPQGMPAGYPQMPPQGIPSAYPQMQQYPQQMAAGYPQYPVPPAFQMNPPMPGMPYPGQ